MGYHFYPESEPNSSENSEVDPTDLDSDSSSLDSSLDSDFDYCEAFRNALAETEISGEVSCFRMEDSAPNPGLFVNGIGTVGLPLSIDQARQIVTCCHQAPFGKGEQTLVDTSVRKTWELNPTQFQVRNKAAWDTWLRRATDDVATSLGLRSGHLARAELYKLLLYEEGALFKPHQDTEKAPGMFGTLVVCLPSQHVGGDLRLLHRGQERVYSTSNSSEFGTSVAAWFSDVIHEVKPITSGYRLVLTYNLIRVSDTVPRTALEMHDQSRHLRKMIQRWEYTASAPKFLVHILEHEYTEASLGPASMKGADANHVSSLMSAIKGTDFTIFFAGLTREVEGGCDEAPGEDWYGHYSGFHELIDENENSLKLENVVDLEGVHVADEIPIEVEDIVQEDPWNNREPEDEEYEGWTGNEGASATQWYKDTVLVLLPRRNTEHFLLRPAIAGEVDRIPVLNKKIAKALHSGGKTSDEHKKLFAFCEAVLDQIKSKGSGNGGGIYGIFPTEADSASDELVAKIADTALVFENYPLFNKAARLTIARASKRFYVNWGRKINDENLPEVKEGLIASLRNLDSIEERWTAFQESLDHINPCVAHIVAKNPLSDREKSTQALKVEIIASALQDLSFDTEPFKALTSSSDGRILAEIGSSYAEHFLTQFIIPNARKGVRYPQFLIEFLVTLRCRLYDDPAYCDTVTAAYKELLQLAESKVDITFMLPDARERRRPTFGYINPQTRKDKNYQAYLTGLRLVWIVEDCFKFGHNEIGTSLMHNVAEQLRENEHTTADYQEYIFPLLAKFLERLRDNPQVDVGSFLTSCLDSIFQRKIEQQPPSECERTLPAVRCTCIECRPLNQFLRNPAEAETSFAKKAEIRTHLETGVKPYVDAGRLLSETIKRHSPYTLKIAKRDGEIIKALARYEEQLKFADTCLHKFDKDSLRCVAGSATPYLQRMFPTYFPPGEAGERTHPRAALAEQPNPPASAAKSSLRKRKNVETVDLTRDERAKSAKTSS